MVMRLSILYQILNGSWYFQTGVFLPDRSLRHHSLHEHTLIQPFCRTNSFRFSYVPASIALWNSLDDAIVSAESLPLFKYHLRTFLL